jgi:hypothetical protein
MSKPRPGRGKYWVRRCHRWLGVLLVLPLLWLVVTGLVLRYEEELGLDQMTVGSGWLLQKYGMIPEGEVRLAKAGEREVAEWGEVLFLDEVMLDEVGELRGAVARNGGVLVATPDYLLVYDAGGEWEQKLGEESLPGVPVEAIGLQGQSVLLTAAGATSRFDEALIGFAGVEPGVGGIWSEVKVGEDADRKRLGQAIAEQAGIPWSRVVLDLHSGNLGGTTGKLIVDLSGLGIIVMSLMGMKLVFRKQRGGAGA